MESQYSRSVNSLRVIERFIVMLLCVLLCVAPIRAQSMQDQKQESKTTTPIAQDVLIIIQQEKIRFTAQKAAQELQLQIFDPAGQLVTDRLWITSQNDSGVGTELTVARNEGVTVAGTSASSDQKSARAARDGKGESVNEKNEALTAAANVLVLVLVTLLGNTQYWRS